MKVLICGDVVGKSGRMALNKNIPEILQREKIDFVIVNGENAAGGFGITKKICEEFYELGVDVITNESLATGSSYDNTDMDGTVFGLGYDRELDNGIFFRVEGAYMEFDDKSLTSTTNSENTITLKDLQGASASISIGKAF